MFKFEDTKWYHWLILAAALLLAFNHFTHGDRG